MNPRFLACAALIIVTPRLGAQQKIAMVPSAVAAPDRYAGNCPARIEFVGHVTMTVPGTRVEYRWERSNGDSGKLLHAQVGTPATPGSDTARGRFVVSVPSNAWNVGFPGRSGQFWEVLHIISPVDIRSAPANVVVECRD